MCGVVLMTLLQMGEVSFCGTGNMLHLERDE
jgi:hypothetical protein